METLCNKLVALHKFNLLRSMVTTCESNENGRFLTQLGLAKLSLEGKSKTLFFSERQNYFEEKTTGSLYSCLGLTICKHRHVRRAKVMNNNLESTWR